MKLQALGALVCVTTAVSACSSVNQPTTAAVEVSTRELAPTEKAALGKVLAQSFKNPGAAQFKWMPVVLGEKEGVTDYCGLVNGPNSSGAMVGFVRFYAQLKKDKKGQFMTARMVTVEEPSTEIKLLESPSWLKGVCERLGYVDFAGAE